jgi:hypothetical protein
VAPLLADVLDQLHLSTEASAVSADLEMEGQRDLLTQGEWCFQRDTGEFPGSLT